MHFRLAGIECLYENFSSRLDKISATVAGITSRRDVSGIMHINAHQDLCYRRDLGNGPVLPTRDYINRPLGKKCVFHSKPRQLCGSTSQPVSTDSVLSIFFSFLSIKMFCKRKGVFLKVFVEEGVQ